MSTISVMLLTVMFCMIQMACLKKVNKKWMKYLPTFIGSVGVVIGIAIYYLSYIPFAMNMDSESVLAENQYLALTIGVLFMPCLVGAVFGIVMAKFLGKKQFLYFLPFIFSIITYLGATIMGLGMISIKEIVWIALFLASGFLLSQEKIWGSIFGMIPGIVFVWMSTNDTGQVINIELPLGMLIIGFYAGCSIGIYRKRQLQNKRNK